MSGSRFLQPAQVKRLFGQHLQQLWRDIGSDQRLGLAISGGVDSFALARLCHVAQQGRPPGLLSAFIVDHGLRSNSAVEAAQVASALESMQIKSRILKLSWDSHGGDPTSLTNLETIARTLRYQALGKACREEGLRTLLTAHHADDQAETVLLRILTRYLGIGLQGIQPMNRTPECVGIYGVDGSGMPRTGRTAKDADLFNPSDILIEAGGVSLHRPLLPFAKNELIEVCRQDQVSWFEDPTNANQRYTLRNAVRHVQSNGWLPSALTATRLCAVSRARHEKMQQLQNLASEKLNSMPVALNLKTATVTFGIYDDMHFDDDPATDYHVKALLLRRLLSLISPFNEIQLPHLDRALDVVFGDPQSPVGCINRDIKPKVDVAGVSIQRLRADLPKLCDSDRVQHAITLQRHPPPIETRLSQQIVIPPPRDSAGQCISDWHLWDGRYWIRVGRSAGSEDTNAKITMQFLSSDILGRLRKSLTPKSRRALERAIKSVSSEVRGTLPVLSTTNLVDGQEKFVALPSLRWADEDWASYHEDGHEDCTRPWWYEIRYKAIDFEATQNHRIDA